MKVKEIDFSKVNQMDAAAAHGISVRTLNRWTDAGCPRNADRSYDLPATIRWRVKCSDHNGQVASSVSRTIVRIR
jgi:hypothetical protein